MKFLGYSIVQIGYRPRSQILSLMHGNYTVALCPRKTIAVEGLNLYRMRRSSSRYWEDRLASDMLALGAITREIYDSFQAGKKERDRRKIVKDHCRQLADSAAVLGLKLSKEQRRRLEKESPL